MYNISYYFAHAQSCMCSYCSKMAEAAETAELENKLEDEDNSRRRSPRSPVWNYFEKTEGNIAICILCKTKYEISALQQYIKLEQ